MASQLEDIWDLPVELATISEAPPADRPLFMAGSDDGDSPTRSTTQTRLLTEDLDALFNLDEHDGDYNKPEISLAQMNREATTRHKAKQKAYMIANTPHMIVPSSSPTKEYPSNRLDDNSRGGPSAVALDGRKPRKAIARMDEARLLGESGFPALIKETKHFKPRGKGHEVLYLR